MDFFRIAVKERTEKQGGGLVVYPDFIVGRSEDLMVRAKNFYAIWDEDKGLWSTDEYDVQRIVDSRLKAFANKDKENVADVKFMRNFSSNGQSTFRKFMSQIGDNAHQLDETLTFQGTQVSKKDYVSKRLPYALAPGDISAWDELVGTLYNPEQRAKIEWAFGSIISGESKTNQKFVVLYGPPGAGKGTIINIALKMFDGYVTTFDAKALGSNGNQFAAAAFAGNPLVAIQHDGDLSRIEDNTTLNSIVSHEIMKVNEKYKPSYDARINAFLVMGTNKPVKITDAQSGLIRRLIDVHPSGVKLPPKHYHILMARIEKELGAIAHHCLQVYKKMGKNYYSNYQPLEMMFKTNAFFNYIEANYDLFEKQNGVSAKQGWNLYKEYCKDAGIEKPMTMYAFKSELGNYFEEFLEKTTIDGVLVRSYYSGFKAEPFKTPVDDDVKKFVLRMDETISLLNLELAEYPAQYARANGTPTKYWDDSERDINGEVKKPKPHQIVDTHLRDLDPYKEHYVKVPENMVVIDFDLKDEDGEKSLERNLQAASEWPPTYGELSKSGEGVHLHYYYTGDISQLDRNFLPGIEIKVFTGNSSLRRRLSRCNNVPIATLNIGALPLKENTRVLVPGKLGSERALRDLIARILQKEFHGGTKPSVDFLKKVLDDAYNDGLTYDVSDLYGKVVLFANNSTNKALECLKTVQSMQWKSEEDIPETPPVTEDRLVFFDIECYPNLFVICWKFEEAAGQKPSLDSVVRMINPKPHEVESLMTLKLVGFNNRNYDNHMMWAAALGYSNIQLYHLSQKMINGAVGTKFPSAYGLSWTDVYDYSTDKMGLKKWQIKLGLKHHEMDLPWDQPVPPERVLDVAEYCANDVVSLEEVHRHRNGDYKARLILADLAEMSANDTTARLTAGIVFGRDKNPQKNFVYTKLEKEFPGYVFELGKSTYRYEDPGEGGYVYAEPGIYENVALLDVASMHPTSIGQLNLFGDYTPKFMALVEAQLALKRGDLETVKTLLDGKLVPYIEEIESLQKTDEAAAKKATADLRWGLKIAVNIVYGLTSAKFDNPFKDIRNVDNIVAKRGALFMIDLKNYVQELGYIVAHIKTDSIKIPNATPEIIEAVKVFGEKYGYTFEHDPKTDFYEKFALVNDAVYVARKAGCEVTGNSFDDDLRDKKLCWSATGAQYQHPYVFKTLFGYEDSINFYDMGETKHVQQGALFLDFGIHEGKHNRSLSNLADDEVLDVKIRDLKPVGYIENAVEAQKFADKAKKRADPNAPEFEKAAQECYEDALKDLIFVGKTGRFTPVLEGYGGGQLWRIKDGKHYAVQGTKGHLWVDSNIAMDLPGDAIDYGYFDGLVDDARSNLEKFLGGSNFSSVDEFLL